MFFCLPFLSAGVLFTCVALAHRGETWDQLAGMTLGGTIAGTIGIWGLLLALHSARQIPDRLGDEIPADKPWRVRSDWASGEVRPIAMTGIGGYLVWAILPLFWLTATLPLLSRMPNILLTEISNWKWLTLAFPLIDFGLLWLLIYGVVHMQKFGASVLHLNSVPGIVGGELSATLWIQNRVRPETGFRFKLSCTEEHTCDGAKKSHVAWQDEKRVAKPLRGNAKFETHVPVRFIIPYDCPETSRTGSGTKTQWQLEVSARMPGPDYISTFKVPVFKTSLSREDFTPTEDPAEESSTRVDTGAVLREAGIRKQLLSGGGVRLIFPAGRHWGMALFATMFFGLLMGLAGLVVYFNSSIVTVLIAIAFCLALGKPLINLWFYRSVVEASQDGLTFCGGPFGIGRTQFVPAEQIDEFGEEDYSSWVKLYVVLHNEEYYTIAKGISNLLVQRAVYDELNSALGRRNVLADRGTDTE
jgi:hypothetical protein